MVPLEDVLLNNESLVAAGSGLVAVVVGCASGGVGLATLEAIVKHTTSPTVLVADHSPETVVTAVQPLNPDATLIPVESGDLTLVKNAEVLAAAVSAALPNGRLDMLILSPTFEHLPGLSSENLNKEICVQFHARMKLITSLLGVLRRSPSPRVVSVLAGASEGDLQLENLATVDNPGAIGVATMTTLFFEHLAGMPDNDRLIFLRVNPEGISADDPTTTVGPAEAGERVLFAATNGRFRRLANPAAAAGTLIQPGSDGVLGSGVYLVNADTVATGGDAHLTRARTEGGRQKVYDRTMGVFDRIANDAQG